MELRKSERAKSAIFPFLITLLLQSFVSSKSLDEICNQGGELTIMYWKHVPYIIASNGNVSGIFPRFVNIIVKKCCHSNVQLKYLESKGPADFYTAAAEVKLNRSTPKFDIALPLHTAKFGKTSFETLPFIAIAESLGIAVLKHSNVSSAKLMTSLLQAWPVLIFIILTAAIAGVVMWFVERQSNSKQFSANFSRGAFDGFWWAFVSMTSVGYGDKYPKSIVGKLLGSCWLVIGMLFVSMFLGTLTTTLMALLLEGTFDIEHEKISVVNGSVAHCLGVAHHAAIKVMTKQDDFYQPLINYEVEAALVDINSLKDVVDYLQRKYNIKVTGILPRETFYGIVFREVATTLTSCFQEYIEKHELLIYRNMSQYSGTQKNKLDPAEDYFGSGGIFSISVYCMVAVLVVFCLSACIWEYHKHRSLILMRNESNVEEFSCEEPSRNGRAPLGTSTSTDAYPSDCPCHMSDPFETVLEFRSRQSDV